MFCEKCDGKVNSNGKCSLCGYDNSIVYNPENCEVKPKSIRSKRLTVFMCLVIISNLFVAAVMLLSLFRDSGVTTGVTVISVITILLCVFEIILAFFILKLKAWALITYMIIGVIAIIIRLLRLDFYVAIVKALLLYFIFDKDWEYFD